MLAGPFRGFHSAAGPKPIHGAPSESSYQDGLARVYRPSGSLCTEVIMARFQAARHTLSGVKVRGGGQRCPQLPSPCIPFTPPMRPDSLRFAHAGRNLRLRPPKAQNA